MARLAHAIAIENPFITADVVEVEEFPSLGRTYAVRGVPKTVMGSISQFGVLPPVQFVGAVPEAEFVERVLEAGIKEAPDDASS